LIKHKLKRVNHWLEDMQARIESLHQKHLLKELEIDK
jgi:hypothetical protein